MDNVIILAGGQGKRMKADMPKPMFTVLEEPMLEWVIKACEGAGLSRICVVKGFEAAQIDAYLNGRYETVLQEERLGTGHAVMQARAFLQEHRGGDCAVLYGDAPFVDADTLENAYRLHKKEGAAVTLLTASFSDPTGYGRIVRGEGGDVSGIVEQAFVGGDVIRGER
uniref:sugar phosphate nucleotidyltransferase n=1 Tax=Ruminococcus champanellensis TaxID=1161942 RepID=UPI0039F60D76